MNYYVCVYVNSISIKNVRLIDDDATIVAHNVHSIKRQVRNNKRISIEKARKKNDSTGNNEAVKIDREKHQ